MLDNDSQSERSTSCKFWHCRTNVVKFSCFWRANRCNQDEDLSDKLQPNGTTVTKSCWLSAYSKGVGSDCDTAKRWTVWHTDRWKHGALQVQLCESVNTAKRGHLSDTIAKDKNKKAKQTKDEDYTCGNGLGSYSANARDAKIQMSTGCNYQAPRPAIDYMWLTQLETVVSS